MRRIRPADDRGRADLGWLDSRHSFSFADYHDPAHMGFRSLRVLNEDRVQPGRGFGSHAHRDMEILSYVIAGALEHADDMGNGSIIRPGELQMMRAGRGVTHSEFNPSKTEVAHFLQIWIRPDASGLEPAYQQRRFDPAQAAAGFLLLASRQGREDSIAIHQDADLLVARMAAGESRSRAIAPDRHAWIQMVRGVLELDGEPIAAGDGAALSGVSGFELRATRDAELLVFDLA